MIFKITEIAFWFLCDVIFVVVVSFKCLQFSRLLFDLMRFNVGNDSFAAAAASDDDDDDELANDGNSDKCSSC